MGAGLLANTECQSTTYELTRRIREQARSHTKQWAGPSLTKWPLSYSKTAARGRRLVHCAGF
ncbi:hypothetical protein AK972_4733 [Pseudomonas yamanorum]|nr:hypothetical protein AK972_4733 [Pseudomonas yamanorum]